MSRHMRWVRPCRLIKIKFKENCLSALSSSLHCGRRCAAPKHHSCEVLSLLALLRAPTPWRNHCAATASSTSSLHRVHEEVRHGSPWTPSPSQHKFGNKFEKRGAQGVAQCSLSCCLHECVLRDENNVSSNKKTSQQACTNEPNICENRCMHSWVLRIEGTDRTPFSSHIVEPLLYLTEVPTFSRTRVTQNRDHFEKSILLQMYGLQLVRMLQRPSKMERPNFV